MEKKFDSYQQKAINSNGGYYLVLAPPGCGKTDILAERIAQARLKGFEFEDMLCLTFTNRASREMRSRVIEVVGESARDIFIGNIHRYCSNFLFSNYLIAENTSVIDEDEMCDILQNFDADYFTNAKGQLDRAKVKEVGDLDAYIRQTRMGHPKHAISEFKGFQQEYLIAQQANFDPNNIPELHKKTKYALLYQIHKEENSLLDFSDILVFGFDFLYKDYDRIFPRYNWIQIDEVQDLNPLQMAIVDELTDTTDEFTVMYLGDEQQAIYSFLGTKLEQLQKLKARCANNILTLGQNYRSPSYMLDVFNTYAEAQLGVNPNVLPKANTQSIKGANDLLIVWSESVDDERARISKMIDFYLREDEEKLAILVPTNKAADDISEFLTQQGYSNFKISGQDMFKAKDYKTLSSIFAVQTNEFNTMAWSRILYGVNAVPQSYRARSFMRKLRELMMTPFDLFTQDSYIARFNHLYETQEFVFFDTETTGLNVLEDDIVQIAAYKVFKGQKVPGSDLNIFIHTDKEIPAMLGTKVNPLVEEYAKNKHYSKEEGLRLFLDYIGDDPILGHNVKYDYHILQGNVRRYLQEEIRMEIYDSLHLIKLVEPRLQKYKLEYLLETLGLPGANSHLANDDIDATKGVVDYCYNRSNHIASIQQKFKNDSHVVPVIKKLQILTPIFDNIQEYLYLPISSSMRTIDVEFRDVHDALTSQKIISPLDNGGDKFNLLLEYMNNEWCNPDLYEPSQTSLFDQISTHINDVCSSINESDLINKSQSITDRIFVMTVHKGKGLEFENVVMLGANRGTYPFFAAAKVLDNPYGFSQEDIDKANRDVEEDARKFYVGISRAKRRLCISYTRTNAFGYPAGVTPFINTIRHYFKEQTPR